MKRDVDCSRLKGFFLLLFFFWRKFLRFFSSFVYSSLSLGDCSTNKYFFSTFWTSQGLLKTRTLKIYASVLHKIVSMSLYTPCAESSYPGHIWGRWIEESATNQPFSFSLHEQQNMLAYSFKIHPFASLLWWSKLPSCIGLSGHEKRKFKYFLKDWTLAEI